MILAHHLIYSAYGFWLPNDPRGSESAFVRNELLREFGPATKVHGHEFVARKPHDRAKRLAAKAALDYPPVRFTGVQARAIGVGFRACAERSQVTVWACAVLPDHVHLVVAAHRHSIETLAGLLKGAATTRLVGEGVHPFQGMKGAKDRVPPCFARKWWAIYKDDEESVVNAIRYVERNPPKAGLPAQREWTCVTPYPRQYQAPKLEKQ